MSKQLRCYKQCDSKYCNVGDVVEYKDDYEEFEFVVTDIFTTDQQDDVGIFGGNRGCIVYDSNFEKYCTIVKSSNIETQKRIGEKELCDSWNNYINKLEAFKKNYECQPNIQRLNL